MDHDLYQHYEEIEARHWWFRARRRILRHLLACFVPRDRGRPRLVDLGCGHGELLEELREEYRVAGVDPAEEALARGARRGLEMRRGSLPDDLPFPDGSLDVVVMADVLEHVEDDQRGLARALALLRPGGVALVTVPAHPWLWTRWDEWNHHHRRYTRARLAALVETPSSRVEFLGWYNSLLFPAMVLVRLRQRLSPPADPTSAARIPPAPLNRLLQAVMAAERHLLPWPGFPYGGSLVAVLRARAT